MRPIKFRVWNKKTSQWIHEPGWEVNLFGETILLGKFMDGVSIEDLNDCVALQFTGLKSKTSVEIYEGDLITTSHTYQRKAPKDFDYRNPIILWPEETELKTYEVVFAEITEDNFYCSKVNGWGLKDKFGSIRPMLGELERCSESPSEGAYCNHLKWDYSLVGNVFENPELCK